MPPQRLLRAHRELWRRAFELRQPLALVVEVFERGTYPVAIPFEPEPFRQCNADIEVLPIHDPAFQKEGLDLEIGELCRVVPADRILLDLGVGLRLQARDAGWHRHEQSQGDPSEMAHGSPA